VKDEQADLPAPDGPIIKILSAMSDSSEAMIWVLAIHSERRHKSRDRTVSISCSTNRIFGGYNVIAKKREKGRNITARVTQG
jgi:hypothetical protein